MDIKSLPAIVAQDDEPAVVTIYQKSGEPYTAADGSKATMSVVGSESRQYKEAKDSIARGQLKARRTRIDPEDIRANRVALAAACVVSWHGWEDQGKAVECTPQNVRSVLGVADHILEQVEAARDAHASFFTSSSEKR